MRTHKINEINEELVGKNVGVAGWVDSAREHGKLIFIDLRDVSGIIQTVVSAKNNKEAFDVAKKVTRESCLEIYGKISARPKGTENEKISTGKIEMQIEKLIVLNICPPLPFEFDKKVNEEVRLKYRFLDLRRPEMQKNLILRSKVNKVMRDFLAEEGFIEFETPILAKSTPEGSRDYVVPSRNHPGKFYALPQSPQLFKQLLMVSGFEKYYQIARCMRDEDTRADRQPEFTQLDIEMSFLTQDTIIDLTERLLKRTWKEVLDVNIKIPFERITYQESMKKYKSDKPDLRKETGEKFAFLWVTDFPLFEYSADEKKYVSVHHPFTMPNLEDFKKDPLKSRSLGYDIVLNGVEIGGGSIRIHDSKIQEKVFEVLKISKEEQQRKFGFLLEALKFGAPPHGGIALGMDRLLQIMFGLDSIREVIAFPKNSEAKDVMLDSPSEISEQQLKEAHIKLDVKKIEKKQAKKEKKIKKKK